MARSYRTNIAPQNGTGPYALGDTVIFNIPTRNNLVLAATESYLKFTLNITNSANAANYARFESAGAHSLIQRIRIFHGSNLLSDISEYSLLAKMLFDLQVATDTSMGKSNILSGTRPDYVTTILPVVSTLPGTNSAADVKIAVDAAFATLAATPAATTACNSGDYVFQNLGTGATLTYAAGTATTYCLNLISLLGTLSTSNYIPLFAITSAPLRIEIQLVDNSAKIGSALFGYTPQLVNCEYIANFIELSDRAISMVVESLEGQPLQFVVPDYRNYAYSMALTQNIQTQVSFPIPAKFSSLKSIFVMIRDSAAMATTRFYPLSCLTQNLTSYQFRVGSQMMPSKEINTQQETFAEVVKAIGSMSDLNHQPSIDKASYGIVLTPAATSNVNLLQSTQSGSFYVGLDLENYSAAPKDQLFSGYNSNTDDIFAVLNFNTPGAAVTARFDAFALFDSVVVFENGTAYVKF